MTTVKRPISNGHLVFVKNIETGHEETFQSLNECARSLSVNPEKIFRYLKTKMVYPFSGKYDIRRENSEYKGVTKKDLGKEPDNTPVQIAIFDRSYELVRLYSSIKHAASLTNIPPTTIKVMLDGKTSDIYEHLEIFHMNDPAIPKATIIDLRLPNQPPTAPKRKSRPVVVTDLTTGELSEWESIGVFADTIGVLRKTLERAIWAGNGRYKQYHVEYVTLEKSPHSERNDG